MKSSILIVTLVLMLSVPLAFSQSPPPTPPSKAALAGDSDHGKTNVCGNCHAPHNGNNGITGTIANNGTQVNGQYLLWAQKIPVTSFGTYTSPSIDGVITEISGGPSGNTDPALYSLLCLSCHDGATSGMVATGEHAVGSTSSSYGLKNDHPVNITYDSVADPGLATATVATNLQSFVDVLPLYDNTKPTVQCATCHEPHNKGTGDYLRVTNSGSVLCMKCHL